MRQILKMAQRQRLLQRALLILGAVLLCSCAQHSEGTAKTPELPQTSEHWFALTADEAGQLPTISDFYQLTAAQQQHFLEFFHAPALQNLPPQQRVHRYLEHHLVNFNYEGKNTLASATMTNMSGNCVSLALLVTTLAQLVDVEVGYRASYAEPMLDFSANIVLSSAHVRSYLFEPDPPDQNNMIVLQRSAITIDYFPGRLDRLGAMLKKEHFEAMIYNNLAADALLAGNLNQAYWLSRAALQRDPNYSPSINLIAVVYRRKGDLLASQQWYEFGLRYSKQPVTLASNYLVLAAQMKNQPLIDRLNNRLRSVDDDNPYVWFYLAYQAEQENKPADAIYYYEKLLKKAPYLHKANLALAKLQFQLGQPESARRALHEALQYSYEPANRQMYQAKLQALEQLDE
jgi:Tfp pilus assembly protein PilF